MIEDIAEVIDEFRREVMPKTMTAINELRKEYPEKWKDYRRMAYLRGEIEGLVFETLCLIASRDRVEPGSDSHSYLASCIKENIDSILKYQREIWHRRNRDRIGDNGITREMITNAKHYPFENLLQLDRYGKALCPFHADKDPSFRVKNNRGKCFGCGWMGDTIAFVMEQEGIGFVDAVKKLQ